MQAFLLAAGYGSRLRPLTNSTPKCLVPINNKPLLSYWLDLFQEHGITEVFINTHYLAQEVENYIQHNDYNISIYTLYEPVLLGSAGTILQNKHLITPNADFLICYADNLTNINLLDLIDYHRNSNCVMTMNLFSSTNPKECGIATLDESNNVINFVEKPQCPTSNLSNSGIYVCSYQIFDFLNENIKDIGHDLIPSLVPNIKGIELPCYLKDIGTLEKYYEAQEDVQNGTYATTN